MDDTIRFVGLDVHKRRTVVAIADGGREGEVRQYGAVETERSAIAKLAGKLARGGKALRFCYEADHFDAILVSCILRGGSLQPQTDMWSRLTRTRGAVEASVSKPDVR